MANKKGNVRSTRRLADMSAAPAPRFCPDDRGARSETWHQFLTSEDRITIRQTHNGRGQLIDFSVSHWHWVGPDSDDWAELVRVDTEHAEVHRHSFKSDGSQVARRKYCDIDGYADYERGMSYAERTVIDRHDDNLRRWEYGY